MNKLFVDLFVAAYIKCGLWACCDENGEPLDGLYTTDDLSKAAKQNIREECRCFIDENAELLAGTDAEAAGQDFYLTRNRHGAGFWDGDWGEAGQPLTDSAHVWGSSYFYPDDNGEISVM
jgi:hypothetical protein